jgi:hypothetical protein
MTLHAASWNPTCVQSFIHVPCLVFEIRELKLNNKKKKKKNNSENELFSIIPCIMPFFNHTPILTISTGLWCQNRILTETESENWIFQMYGHNAGRPVSSLYTRHYRA